LLVLGAGYGANHMDRNLLSILIEPISREFHLSDTQIGLLSGLGFAVFFVLFGFPLARLADRFNRRNLVAIAQSLFSLFTALSGVAQNFISLLLMRVGVAVGEAGAAPPALSILSDMFPIHQRGRVMAVYTAFAYGGFLCGFLFGGLIAQAFGWRVAFVVAGIPGLIISLLVVLFVREPVRRTSQGVEDRSAAPLPMGATIVFLLSQRAFVHLAIGSTLSAACTSALTLWLPVLLIRSFGLNLAQVGTTLALMFGIGGGAGALAIGALADHLGKRDIRWHFWIVAAVTLTAAPALIIMLCSYNLPLFLACLLVPAIASSSYAGPAVAMMQSLAPPRMRGVATSVYMLGTTLFGTAFGVQIVGILSDLLAPVAGKESLRFSLLAMTILPVWSAIHFGLGSRWLRADLARAARTVDGALATA
jgi:MFS family permease